MNPLNAPAATPSTRPKTAAAATPQPCWVYMIAVVVPLSPMIEATEKSNSPTQKAHSRARQSRTSSPCAPKMICAVPSRRNRPGFTRANTSAMAAHSTTTA